MSLNSMKNAAPPAVDMSFVKGDRDAAEVLLPMGVTSENVSERFGVGRAEQDQFAAESHARAKRAQDSGLFDAEIIPISVNEGVRGDTTVEKLARLKAVFKKGGSTTAGNSSQVSDGAAACLVTTRMRAQELGLPMLGVLRSFAVVGVPPAVMGIGPAVAIPAAAARAGLSLGEVDLYELNEAFASQATYCIK
ncbi:unnamed protein product, partial [Discosporangium mesarthrocarpum]